MKSTKVDQKNKGYKLNKKFLLTIDKKERYVPFTFRHNNQVYLGLYQKTELTRLTWHGRKQELGLGGCFHSIV